MFTIPAILVFVGGLSAFLGRVLQIIQQYVQDDFRGWAFFFYVAAGVFVGLAVVELIFGMVRLHRRSQARHARGRTLPKRKPRH